MESNKAFIESYIFLQSISPLGDIVGDHQINIMADEEVATSEGITEDQIIDSGRKATEVLEKISAKLGGDLPAAHNILEHYARVEVRKERLYDDQVFEEEYFKMTGKKWSRNKANRYCENAFTLAECLIRHHDTGFWF